MSPQVVDAAVALLERLMGDSPEILSIVEGEGSTETVTEAILARATELRPDLGVQILWGGQPHQAYVFGLE